jgi:hypothetical protein
VAFDALAFLEQQFGVGPVGGMSGNGNGKAAGENGKMAFHDFGFPSIEFRLAWPARRIYRRVSPWH